MISSRKTLAAVSAVLVAGGTVAFMQTRLYRRSHKSGENGENSSQNGICNQPVHGARPTRKGLRSLHYLAATLLSQMGPNGMRNLMGLVAIAVSSVLLCPSLFLVDCMLSSFSLFTTALSCTCRKIYLWIRLVLSIFGLGMCWSNFHSPLTLSANTYIKSSPFFYPKGSSYLGSLVELLIFNKPSNKLMLYTGK